jgi:hypothetical protein
MFALKRHLRAPSPLTLNALPSSSLCRPATDRVGCVWVMEEEREGERCWVIYGLKVLLILWWICIEAGFLIGPKTHLCKLIHSQTAPLIGGRSLDLNRVNDLTLVGFPFFGIGFIPAIFFRMICFVSHTPHTLSTPYDVTWHN